MLKSVVTCPQSTWQALHFCFGDLINIRADRAGALHVYLTTRLSLAQSVATLTTEHIQTLPTPSPIIFVTMLQPAETGFLNPFHAKYPTLG